MGGFLIIASLMPWYVPGIVFAWAGLFGCHEFGTSSTA
jgi:hypothetical protein